MEGGVVVLGGEARARRPGKREGGETREVVGGGWWGRHVGGTEDEAI